MNWREAFKETFGDMPEAAIALKGLRNREGLTQMALGELLGIKQTNISNMETENVLSERIWQRSCLNYLRSTIGSFFKNT